MALIGPRPERPAFCAEFEKRIHGWNYRALVKPGLSGLAQVRGGYDLLPKEKVALDLWRMGYPSLRIARVTDPPHSSIISTALRFCSSVQLGIRELLTGPIRSNYFVRTPICFECNDAMSSYGSAFATCWTAQQCPVTTW